MKLKTGFVLHSVGNEHIVVAVNERTKDFRGMVRLNNSGAYLWSKMQSEFTKETLVSALLDKYEVTQETAAQTVDTFLDDLNRGGLLEA